MKGDGMELAGLTAAQITQLTRAGDATCADVTDACLAAIDAREEDVQAWEHLNPDYAQLQAKAGDSVFSTMLDNRPLHGVPVGIKDIIDVQGLPSERGSVLYQGRKPRSDAFLVERLKEAGAVIMGKTVTTELANMFPGKTRNPHNPAHTPGGSSSGSAAAVAAGMVPVAIGTQTNGSVIRPAAYCGVVGFKPSHGAISREGVLLLSRTLDTVGIFGRTVEDVALVGDVITAFDREDEDMTLGARLPLSSVSSEEPPLPPDLAFVQSPVWDKAEDQTKEAFGELMGFLGDRCHAVELGPSFDSALDWHRKIMAAEMAFNLNELYAEGKDKISDVLGNLLVEGQGVSAVDYQDALSWREAYVEALDEMFEDYDAIITPAAPGPAPLGLETTGDASFCTLWSLAGVPAINLPLLTGENGLPIGVQLIGRKGDDARLLRTARWLANTVAQALD